MYKHIFIDLDDTLFDFKKGEFLSIQQLLTDYKLPVNQTTIANYQNYNQSLWRQIEQGTLTKEQLLETRFPGFFKRYNLSISDGISVDQQFRTYLVKNTQLIPDSLVFLNGLKTHNIHLYAASNGIFETQYQRLELTNLFPYFDDIFISEKIGFAKPDKRFFEYAFDKLDLTDLSEVVMIGDSLTSDIQGANNANINAIWFNQQHLDTPHSLQIQYQSDKLKDILKYLLK